MKAAGEYVTLNELLYELKLLKIKCPAVGYYTIKLLSPEERQANPSRYIRVDDSEKGIHIYIKKEENE